MWTHKRMWTPINATTRASNLFTHQICVKPPVTQYCTRLVPKDEEDPVLTPEDLTGQRRQARK